VVFRAKLTGTIDGDTLTTSWVSAKRGTFVLDVSGWENGTFVYDDANDTLYDGLLYWHRL
jgi:hypothetical protein